ncbi:MAG: hypothetical protein R3C05_08640 [Pirellulaceae bacterium]
MARFNIFDVFSLETVGATFDFTGRSDTPLATFDEVTVASATSGRHRGDSGGEVQSSRLTRLGDAGRRYGQASQRGRESLLSQAMEFLADHRRGIRFSFKDAFYEYDADQRCDRCERSDAGSTSLLRWCSNTDTKLPDLQELCGLSPAKSIKGLEVDIAKLFGT